jgi:hypothetical protein
VSANDEEELIRTNLLAMRDAGGNALGPINEFVEMLVGSEPWNRYRRTPEVLINWIVESSSYENGMKNA